MHEDIAGEQRQLHAMAAVVPAVDGLIERQEALHFSLPQMFRDALLVPSRCIGCVPERLLDIVSVRESQKFGITCDRCTHGW